MAKNTHIREAESTEKAFHFKLRPTSASEK